MNRKEKVFKIENINDFKDKLLFFSKSKENVILLDSNSKKNDYEFIFSYGKISELKSFDNSLDKLDNYIKQVDDWIFGFISYDLKDEIEGFNSKNLKYFDVPNLSFFQPSTIWVFDGVELKALYFDEKELFDVWNEINKIHISCDSIKSNPNVELEGRLSKEEYIKDVVRIKNYITNGDCYQVNYSQEFSANYKGDPWNIYKSIRKLNPAPYSSFIRFDEKYVVSHYLNQINQLDDSEKTLKKKIIKFREDELNHKDIAYEKGATKKGPYSILDKLIKTGSKIAINISEKI